MSIKVRADNLRGYYDLSIEEFVENYFAEDSIYLPPNSERLWIHDFLHALLNTSTRTARGEEITSIYQAVLLQDNTVSTKPQNHFDHGIKVTFEMARDQVLPSVRNFLKRLSIQHHFTIKSKLNDFEIAEHYKKALLLSDTIKKLFGKSFSNLSLQEIKHPPFGAKPIEAWHSCLTKMEHSYPKTRPLATNFIQNNIAIFNRN